MVEEKIAERESITGQVIQRKPRSRKHLTGLGLLTFILALTAVSSAGVGAVPVSPAELWGIVTSKLFGAAQFAYREEQEVVFWFIRLPRICLGILVGAGLSVAGALLQGLFRNPLADPTLIGISSGAMLAAVLTIVFSIGLGFLGGYMASYSLAVAAFSGACLTTLLVYRLARANGEFKISTMLLVGIAINAFVMAVTGLITSLANDQQLRDLTFWNLGSLGGATWTNVLTLLPFVAATLVYTPGLSKSLNLLALGENQAGYLGVDLRVLRRRCIVLATLAVGVSVAMAGNIGFVALIVPHMVRKVFGPDHRVVIPASALGGAIILTVADTLSRTLTAPAELPIGVITALMGAPVFIYILLKETGRRV
ncbi:iron ABC transporter permease [Ravibacter arvi]|uniref:Iron ABC transporter permease n=1 Tax=Ravibacter arvi TaxID=2051041 RepID=A0ABP8LRR8_9BACT